MSAAKPAHTDEDARLQIVLARIREMESLIAAVKVQRWDVVKWVITVNLALTTAEVALRRSGAIFVLVAALTALMGTLLVWHYNRRATGARESQRDLNKWLSDNFVDLTAIDRKAKPVKKSPTYDYTELLLFTICMWASVLLLLILSLGPGE